MRTHELKAWLLGPREQPASPGDVAAFLGEDVDGTPTSTRQSLGFVLAALRDTYQDDLRVWHWLVRPRREVRGARPVDLLRDGRIDELEALVVNHWNLHASGDAWPGVTRAPSRSSVATLRRRLIARRP
jgi:hypothetical protein